MEIRFLRLPAIEALLGLKKSAIQDRVNAGLLPRPVSLGGNAVAFVEAEIHAVNAARVAGRTDEEVRALVARLHDTRKVAA